MILYFVEHQQHLIIHRVSFCSKGDRAMCAIYMEEQELTTDEVAKRLRVHRLSVLRYIRRGQLRARKQGQEYRIKISWLEEYIQSTEVHPREGE